MNLLLRIASMVLIGAVVAIGLAAAGSLARQLGSTRNSAFWRGVGSAPVLLSMFTPWLALTASALMRLNGEFVVAPRLLVSVGLGALLGAAAATAEVRYIRSRPTRWRRAHDAATLLSLAASAVYVAAHAPHAVEQFWSFLAAFGVARFLVLALRIQGIHWVDAGSSPASL